MLPFTLDPLAFVTGLIRTHEMNKWAKDLLGLHLSIIAGFFGAMGEAIVTYHEPLLRAFGWGCLAVPVVIGAQVAASPRLRSIVVTYFQGRDPFQKPLPTDPSQAVTEKQG